MCVGDHSPSFFDMLDRTDLTHVFLLEVKLRSRKVIEIDPAVFLEIFTPGRTDAYGWNNSTLHKQLGESQIQQHLKGVGRLGIIPLNPDGRCKWAAIDLDDLSVAAVRQIVETAQSWGLRLYVERSRSNGYHLWLFFADWVPAVKAKAVLHGWPPLDDS